MKLLPDTHIIIWVLENNKALSAHHKSLITDTTDEKFISQVTFMEIAIKMNIGKLPDFAISLEDFIRQTVKDRFIILWLSNNHFAAYTSLPIISDHKDPFAVFL